MITLDSNVFKHSRRRLPHQQDILNDPIFDSSNLSSLKAFYICGSSLSGISYFLFYFYATDLLLKSCFKISIVQKSIIHPGMENEWYDYHSSAKKHENPPALFTLRFDVQLLLDEQIFHELLRFAFAGALFSAQMSCDFSSNFAFILRRFMHPHKDKLYSLSVVRFRFGFCVNQIFAQVDHGHSSPLKNTDNTG